MRETGGDGFLLPLVHCRWSTIDQQNVRFHVGFSLETRCHRQHWANSRRSPPGHDCVSQECFASDVRWDDYRSQSWHSQCVNVQGLFPRFASVEMVPCATVESRKRSNDSVSSGKEFYSLVRDTTEHAGWRCSVVVHPSVDRAYYDEDARWANGFSPVVLERSNRFCSIVPRTLSSRKWSWQRVALCREWTDLKNHSYL